MTPSRWLAATIAAVAAIALATTACQRKDKGKNKGTKRRIAKVVKPPPPVNILSETVVRRGSEPHRLLRYRQSTGTDHALTRTAVATVTEIDNRTHREPKSLPPVLHKYTARWKAAGQLEVDIARPRVTAGKSAALTAFAREQTRRFESMLAGRRVTIAVDSRGVMSDVSGFPRDSPARLELGAALVDAIVPLPEVPVGVGARWRVVRAIPRSRTWVKQTATFDLVAIDGDKLTIKAELSTVGERQPIDLRGPEGSASELLALRVTQKGELTVDLGVPTVAAGKLERSDVIHLRSVRDQKTLRDYYAESAAEITFETK